MNVGKLVLLALLDGGDLPWRKVALKLLPGEGHRLRANQSTLSTVQSRAFSSFTGRTQSTGALRIRMSTPLGAGRRCHVEGNL